MISGVCRCTPPTWYADGRAERSRSRAGRCAGVLPAPDGADGEHGDEVVGLDHARARCPGPAPRVIAVTLQPGTAIRVAPTRLLALFGAHRIQDQLGQAVRPGAVSTRRRRTPPSRLGSVSRWSAPQSMTRTSSGSSAVTSPDLPCGSARKTTSAAESTSAVVSCSTRWASETQVRVDGDERLAGVLVRGDDGHLELGMGGEQAQQLAACVAARAGDGNGAGTWINLRFDGSGFGSSMSTEAATSRRCCGSAQRRRRESARATETTGSVAPDVVLRQVHDSYPTG